MEEPARAGCLRSAAGLSRQGPCAWRALMAHSQPALAVRQECWVLGPAPTCPGGCRALCSALSSRSSPLLGAERNSAPNPIPLPKDMPV
ncbi:hypothetical protein NDU88_001053 [Pleurodeles waltl]|uniref:Uncharacterized protein n=1 Tax=Pleurodeles waltl TaxID=8319 RepID=A0AAV7Q4V7_PLEWA|nr:hypothetical protein NDU88_001053 [Pleurodeles waltl]